MSRTDEQYKKSLISLMPKGKIWDGKNSITSILSKILYALGAEPARIEERSENLFDEKDTRTSSELLTEHETDFGLPDEGDSISTIESKRQEEIHSMYLKVGQQFKQYFIDIALALGYTITITEFQPFWCGYGTSGTACGEQKNLFYWLVNIYTNSVEESYEVNITKLINKITKAKPAHTHVLFEFYGAEFSRAFSRAFNRIPHYDNSWIELDFSRDFDNSFANAYDYDGVNLTGAYNHAFDISFDRHSGGDFEFNEFSDAFFKVA